MIVDLRFNGGGDELLARSFAGRFADEPVVYSKNRYRVGPKHDQLGPVLDRVLEPRGPWRYEAPVVCLFGQLTLSSAESLAAMFGECPNVTTMGAPTGGSSANPRRIELECGIKVNLPRWLDLLPDGTPIERHGVLPDVPLEHTPTAFTDSTDPVFEAAVARLTK
jgi:carboxyl-terminal processing protease